MTKRWIWIYIGIACLTFLEKVIFANSGVSDTMKWTIYGLLGLGVLAKAFPQSNVKKKAENYVQQGYSQQDAGNFASAESSFKTALSILEELEEPNEKQIGKALQHSNLGMLYHQWGKTKEAEKSLKIAVQVYTEIGRFDDCAPLYASLGKLYFDIKKFDLAEEYAEHSLDLYKKRGRSGEAIKFNMNLLEEIRRSDKATE